VSTPTDQFSAFVAEHKALNDLVVQYNQINWRIHSIFIPVSTSFVALLAYRLMVGNAAIDFAMFFFGSLAGYFLTLSWKLIYVRHSHMLRVLYKRLQEIEKNIDFRVHRILDEDDKSNAGRFTATHTVINWSIYALQLVLLLISIGSLVRLGRTLHDFPAILPLS
jgi:hypothetical protein